MTEIAADTVMAPLEGKIRVCLLGVWTVTVHGTLWQPPPFRVQELLAALLLDPQIWPRERLAGLLFPDVSERRARKRLSHILWQARTWLPALPLETTSTTVSLNVDTIDLDVRAFHLAAEGKDADAWLHALELYRGDLLEGVYADWLLVEREAIYLRYVDLSHRVCDALWRQGRVAELLPVVERLVQREMLDETALRMLMRAYHTLGRRGAALAAYERCAALALDEMGIELEPATCALAQAIQATSSAVKGCLPVADDGVSGLASQSINLDVARSALMRGDMVRVRRCLVSLNACPDVDAEALQLLAIDLALLVEDYTRAEDLLNDMHIGRTETATTLAVDVRRARLALKLYDAVQARDLATDILVAACEVEDCAGETEVAALLVLADAQQQLGDGWEAARSIERALWSARERGFYDFVVRALLLQGQQRLYRGRYEGAAACFHEARAIALEHDLRYELAMALRGLRIVLSNTKAMDKALAVVQEELSLWRDMGLEHCEAMALEGMAIIQNHLGLSVESLRTLRRAQEISKRRGDPVRVATNRYHLACAMLYHDDEMAQSSIEVARRALDIFRAYDQPGWAAAALEIIGYAHWVAGQYAAALDALREAEAITQRLGEVTFLPELFAYQGVAHLGLGDVNKALALTRRAVALLAQGGVSGEVEPEILYAHAMALFACDLASEAKGYLERAYNLLLDGAADFEDEPARLAFFHRNPTMRRLMRALHDRDMAPHDDAVVRVVKIPVARGDGLLRVTWTVDAGPADAALLRAEGAVPLRRARLMRLLAEARAQGGSPRIADLAGVLHVSQRTIQRDLATLREVG